MTPIKSHIVSCANYGGLVPLLMQLLDSDLNVSEAPGAIMANNQRSIANALMYRRLRSLTSR